MQYMQQRRFTPVCVSLSLIFIHTHTHARSPQFTLSIPHCTPCTLRILHAKPLAYACESSMLLLQDVFPHCYTSLKSLLLFFAQLNSLLLMLYLFIGARNTPKHTQLTNLYQFLVLETEFSVRVLRAKQIIKI